MSRRIFVYAFFIGFAMGFIVAFLAFMLLPRIEAKEAHEGMIRVGSVEYKGLHVTVYANFTLEHGVPYVDTIYVKYYWSKGLPGGMGEAFCTIKGHRGST